MNPPTGPFFPLMCTLPQIGAPSKIILGFFRQNKANHTIQSTGATITKNLQVKLWNLQPVGVHPWHIQLLNVHDEILACILPELKEQAKGIVDQVVQDYRDLVPLISIGWSSDLKNWSEK